ncbi:hypothetical protein QS468_06505 [Bacillus subtilis]|nr:hypothetical protein [Bacillus subtilis]
MDIALAAQARHAERPAEGDLDPRYVERQGMKVEKPFTNKVANVLQAQHFLIQHGNPLGTAAADQLFDGFRAFQVKRLQTKQADIATAVGGIFQATTINIPAYGA